MSQVKVFGLRENLKETREQLSEIIHTTIVDMLSFPKNKKFHRFISFDQENMIFPDDKSQQYIIIEIIMMKGRETNTKKNLIKSLFQNINKELKIALSDIEICIIESEPSNWGFRGITGDEIKLNYEVNL
ncbi:tautomerase family protein [Francisella sp. Scap27]|jgi:phenylpyruvate tautomerase PptA (4-oxalocrotonate tautomerase family)|uniref:tautomerase family protein n=1 Tax=Francisella sp. Scap27 TaxID=2589986 RepID=UPI0015BEB714|nr:tautomerase family protein [Francisella sp. Scap27]QLE79750.1 tautomerase family protein [Francisella sp. Scap27]